jgi:phosphoribosylformylglycinamidine synthase
VHEAPGVTSEQAARNRYLLGGVVSGISHYGNCIGIPTVGGEVVFDPTYNNNCLVNAMCVGIIRKDRLLKGIAEGPGNTALMVGAKTGRDGVQGATFASVDLADDYAKLRPAVQVGDPFMEKLLLEATLEIMGLPGLVGVQDLGAAGLTCSSVEMAARAGTGMQLDLDRVPQRASDLSAYEMMLSESQERMMVVVEKDGEQAFLDVFQKWGLTAVPCGEVLPQKTLIVVHDGSTVAKMPNQPLANEAPDYDRPTAEPDGHKKRRHLTDADIEVISNRAGDTPGAMLWSLLTHPSIASKRGVFQQYDYLVRGNTVQGPGLSDAAVLRIPETGQGIVLSTDGSGRHTYLDPLLGGARAVLESARNVLACGAKPLGITNCLNFGNPEKPDRMWQLVQGIEGMGDACRELSLPVTGGNVSLYNETGGESILPTPVIGMVGLLDDWKKYVRNSTDTPELELFVLGSGSGRLDGSALAFDIGRVRSGELHGHNYDEFRRCAKFLQSAAAEGGIAACHDVSDGGISVALFELCSSGCDVDIAQFVKADYDRSEFNVFAALFGEEGHRWVIAVDSSRKGWLRTAALHEGAPMVPIGKTGGGKLVVRNGETAVIDAAMDKLTEAYDNALDKLLSAR